MSSTFCCELCGLLHSSEHTSLDTWCPDCQAERSKQALVVCVRCAMPMSLGHTSALGAPLSCQNRCLAGYPQPTVGMWTRVACDNGWGRGRVVRVGRNTCYIDFNDGASPARANLRRNGFVMPGTLLLVNFIQKPEAEQDE